jgi:hypothetical protein
MNSNTPRQHDKEYPDFLEVIRQVSGKVTITPDFHSRVMDKIRQTQLFPAYEAESKEKKQEKSASIAVFSKKNSAQKGEGAIELISSAERFIYVTHISREVLCEHYIDIMLDKLAQGVSVTRIIGFIPDVPLENYTWLRRFRDAEGNLLPGYRESYIQGLMMQHDIAIADNRRLLLSLPAHSEIHDLPRVFETDDPDFIASYNAVFTDLLIRAQKQQEIPEALSLYRTLL